MSRPTPRVAESIRLVALCLVERAEALGREAQSSTMEQSVDANWHIKKTYINKFAHVRSKPVEQGS